MYLVLPPAVWNLVVPANRPLGAGGLFYPPPRLSASTSQHTTVVLTSGPQVFGPSESHDVVLFLLNRHHSASGEMLTDRVAAQSARSRAFIVVETQLHKHRFGRLARVRPRWRTGDQVVPPVSGFEDVLLQL